MEHLNKMQQTPNQALFTAVTALQELEGTAMIKASPKAPSCDKTSRYHSRQHFNYTKVHMIIARICSCSNMLKT